MPSSPTGRFSEIPAIQALVQERMAELNRAGIMVSVKKMHRYGTQLGLEGQHDTGLIDVYYSKKKGISLVDCSRNPTSGAAIRILRGASAGEVVVGKASEREEAFSSWIGTDESGKGDFFGPLVVCGFFIRRDQERELRSIGVADSKSMTSRRIDALGRELYRTYKDRISIVAPHMPKYNELYGKFGNLNRLLAWGHARVIRNLIDTWQGERGETVDGAVADQFGDERYIRTALRGMEGLNLVQRHRGESNIAVAAASVFARHVFEKRLHALEGEFEMPFPPGAGAQVVEAGRRFVKKYGKERLREVAKVHFKTFGDL